MYGKMAIAWKTRSKQYLPSIFDMRSIYYEQKCDANDPYLHISLYDRLADFLNTSYVFMPYMVYAACAHDLKVVESVPGHLHNYELLPGKKIHVSFW